ncbi:MAG: tetraacyldisaccharide 4'-kinase [Bacteroidia bacterium]|nr:tetraacyldisaccharide 4'-kinase [Bacteroidia bacterium]
MKIWQIPLYPFTLLYTGLSNFRNHLYNIGYKKSFSFEVKVLSVGNLTVGGTGKTPHIEYLIRLLENDYRLATLSRGYGRQTRGFILANEQATARRIGDEPMQFYRKFGTRVSVAVGEERALAIPSILMEKPDTELILLDDAFQHRPIRPHLNILLNDYHRPFYEDYPFPAGRLRESRYGARRADIVVVTKAPPDLDAARRAGIIRKLSRYTRQDTPVFFSSIRYGMPQWAGSREDATQPPNHFSDRPVLLFAGIANLRPLENYVRENFQLAGVLSFGDHHAYTAQSIKKIRQKMQSLASQAPVLLTTEKDFVKLSDPALGSSQHNLPLYYLPMEVYFPQDTGKFAQMVRNRLLKIGFT